MRVHELIAALQSQDPLAEVVVRDDGDSGLGRVMHVSGISLQGVDKKGMVVYYAFDPVASHSIAAPRDLLFSALTQGVVLE